MSLDAMAKALERKRSVDETIVFLEPRLRDAFAAERVEIVLFADGTGTPDGALEIPLALDGERMGALRFDFAEAPEASTIADARRLAGAIAATLLWRVQSDDRARLRAIARTDALTGLPNRLAFDERLAEAMRTCGERRVPLALTFLDIDFFKAYNDVYGHVAGDNCLQNVARVMADRVDPESDLIARYGGEEFALISAGATVPRAIDAAQRIVDDLAKLAIPHRGSSLGRISLSAGISGRVPTIADSVSDLMRDADRALYRAKMLGRNRIATDSFVSSAPTVARHARSRGPPPRFEDATIGRESDVARIGSALRNARMLRLVGPAGVGKSRLARAIGFSAQSWIPDGVAYVDLSVLGSLSDPLATIAAALDVDLEGIGAFAAIRDALAGRRTLLILDDAASPDRRIESFCDELLAALDDLSILATSRGALGCRDERVVVVPPLGDEPALALLCVRAGLRGESADDPTLREIVRLTRGIPSAIESVARHLVFNGAASTLNRLR
jgi:diguanylate cyclase (GGDEF)-like protein